MDRGADPTMSWGLASCGPSATSSPLSGGLSCSAQQSWIQICEIDYRVTISQASSTHNMMPIAVHRVTGSNGDVDLLQAVPSDDPTPDRLALSGQFKVRLDAAMEILSPQERTAFVLRHFEGLSIEDIGQSLGTNANATKHSIFRAVQKLRHSLAPFVSVT